MRIIIQCKTVVSVVAGITSVIVLSSCPASGTVLGPDTVPGNVAIHPVIPKGQPTITPTGHWPVGPCGAVAVCGDTLWMGAVARLEVFSLSDTGPPSSPVREHRCLFKNKKRFEFGTRV